MVNAYNWLMKVRSIHPGLKRAATAVAIALLCAVAVMAAVFAGTPYPGQWQQFSTDRLNTMGRTFMSDNQIDSALVCYAIAASRLENTNSDERKACIMASFWMGHLYQTHYYNYQKAADCLLVAQQAAAELGDSMLMSLIYHELGTLYLQYESLSEDCDMAQTLTNLKKAYWYRTQNDSIRDLFMFNLVTTGMQFSKVSQVLDETRHYCAMHPQENYVTHLCQAALCVERGDIEQAVSWIDRSLMIIKDKNVIYYARLNAVERLLKCIMLNKLHRPQEALDELGHYLKLCRDYDLKEGYPDYYDMLARYYYEQGDKVKANECKLRYYEAVDSLSGLTQLTYLTKAPLVLDLQKANEEVHVQKIQRERMTQIVAIVILAALIFLMLMIMLYRRNRQLAESYRALYEQNLEQLAHLEESRKMVHQLQQPLPVQQEEDPSQQQADLEQVKATSGNDVDQQLLQEIYQRVNAVMESSPEIYDSTFTMSKLNVMVGSNIRYISYAIGQFADCDFKTLLSQYRIREACRRMNDVEKYGKYTIEAIAKSVGVTSRTSFVQNFKKQTGLTPSAYFKLAREKASAK